MIKSILVPLDGSTLAECALPYAEELAGCCNGQVTLVSVAERIQGYRRVEDPGQPSGGRLIPEGMPKEGAEVGEYLAKVAKSARDKGLNIKTEVLMGNPAQEIVIYADEHKCDVIVMSSHGRSGPSRLAFGSVADKVFRTTCVPVLMVRAPGCNPDPT